MKKRKINISNLLYDTNNATLTHMYITFHKGIKTNYNKQEVKRKINRQTMQKESAVAGLLIKYQRPN